MPGLMTWMNARAYGAGAESKRIAVGVLVWIAGVGRLLAHEGELHSVGDLAGAWVFEPGIILPLILTACLYGNGLKKLWQVSPSKAGLRKWQAVSFALGWLTLVIALVSPLHPWGQVLFSAHMTQHELLMLVAAPLLVLGRPMLVFLKALPAGWGRELAKCSGGQVWSTAWRIVSNPFSAWLIHAIVLWGWHIPNLFQATIEHEWIHALQHTSFLFSALLFWWAILHGRQRHMGYGLAVLYMFTTALHSGLLGALITLARFLIYPVYSQTTASWGLTALEDQELGGLIMWVPAGLVYVVAGLALFAGWLNSSERQVSEREKERSLELQAESSHAGKVKEVYEQTKLFT